MGKKGVLITFEGIDGSGKSKHARLLSDVLKKMGLSVVATREPGGTALGLKLRELLLRGEADLSPKAELLLYMADRAQHVSEIIAPALEKGEVVVCERYVDSTLVYQGYGRGIDIELIGFLNRWVTGGYMPDLTIVMTVPVDVALQRLGRRQVDKVEQNDVEFFRKLDEAYRGLANKSDRSVKIIDSSVEVEEVHKRVKDAVINYLKEVGYIEGR